MNERINELYKQAHIEHRQEYFSSVVDPTITSVYVTRQFNYELFAELIVKECITLVEPTPEHRADPHGYIADILGVQLLDHIAECIKEHFGVE